MTLPDTSVASRSDLGNAEGELDEGEEEEEEKERAADDEEEDEDVPKETKDKPAKKAKTKIAADDCHSLLAFLPQGAQPQGTLPATAETYTLKMEGCTSSITISLYQKCMYVNRVTEILEDRTGQPIHHALINSKGGLQIKIGADAEEIARNWEIAKTVAKWRPFDPNEVY